MNLFNFGKSEPPLQFKKNKEIHGKNNDYKIA
jgi:hypothetical protein